MKLTQKSNGETCIRCQAPDAYSCHYNGVYQYMYGKGTGIKCSDIATAEFCHQCDQIFSEGLNDFFKDRTDKSEQFLHYIMLTNIRRFKNGVLIVG